MSFEEQEAANAIAAFKEQVTTGAAAALSDAELEQVMETSESVTLARRRVRVLYERCLVACALYEHFWIRYANYLEVNTCHVLPIPCVV